MKSTRENGGSPSTLCREKMHRSRNALQIRYPFGSLTKNFFKRSAETSAAIARG
jgi:hypothetical protein